MIRRSVQALLWSSAILVNATAVAASDAIGEKPLPATATFVCEEVIDGVAAVNGDAPVSIAWKSYGTSQPAGEVARHYEQVFGRPPVSSDSGGQVWRLDGGPSCTVFSATKDLPWLRCASMHRVSPA
jgi:hypothetical protein